MGNPLTYGKECFIARKQNQIKQNVLKKREINKKIMELQGEIEFLDDEIEADRYSIRRKIGRN